MSTRHTYPACPACRGTTFISLPDVAFELHRSTSVFGLAATSHAGMLTMNLVICQTCGRTDTFIKNAAEIMSRVAGATVFSAVPPK